MLPGMELRDYFAAQALTGLIATNDYHDSDIARLAYSYADDMLAERNKRNSLHYNRQGNLE